MLKITEENIVWESITVYTSSVDEILKLRLQASKLRDFVKATDNLSKCWEELLQKIHLPSPIHSSPHPSHAFFSILYRIIEMHAFSAGF